MCDEHTIEDNAALAGADAITRRRFGVLAGAVGVAAMLPTPADAAEIAGKDVTIATPDGTCDAYWVAPKAGKHPAVLVWPDIMGLRPAFRQMADRLAQSGYSVLVVNQFYRSVKSPILAAGESYDQPEVRAKIGPWRALLTQAATTSDARAFVTWIDAQPQTDRKRGIATTGYCMGGPMVLLTAAERPDRVRAGATFHGGGMATDKPDSPHLRIPSMKASFLIAVAENDDKRNSAEKETLRTTFAANKRPAEIEVYAGTMHGWCPPDSKVYNEVQANRAWDRQLALFRKAL